MPKDSERFALLPIDHRSLLPIALKHLLLVAGGVTYFLLHKLIAQWQKEVAQMTSDVLHFRQQQYLKQRRIAHNLTKSRTSSARPSLSKAATPLLCAAKRRDHLFLIMLSQEKPNAIAGKPDIP